MTHCRDCKFFSIEGCAVAPGYWQAQKLLSTTDESFRKKLAPAIQPCPEWQQSEQQTLSLTLSETWWKLSVDRRCPDSLSRKILEEMERQIRSQLGLPESQCSKSDDLPF
ncbi:hypothetical protein [Egbenema bharatensis]|uniref:hypothetical protein n=1 Tax=Egbenema bharatensis TaxID=3463334 RepID=UPI003A89525B